MNFDKVDKIRGLDITVVIKSQNIDHSYELLKQFNFPFIQKGDELMAKLSSINKNKRS